MARYTDQEKQTLQSISIVEIMAHLDKNLYNQKGMYYSPFRDEATPSFHIDIATNRWYDFGTSEGGGLFDFVCRIAGITRGEVYDWLASFRSIIPESEYREVVEKAKKVKVFTMEKPKTMADTLYLYRQPITSEKVREALLEPAKWIGPDGKKAYGNLNVNGGRPISINLDGKKQQFLVSIHQPTNRVVGMSLDSFRSFFFDKDNNLCGKGMYGVPFTAEQANALIEGKAVVHSGQRKDGEAFTCCIQFDAAKREPTVSHPSWYKEAQRAGMEAAPKQKLEEKAAQQQKASQEQGQSQKRSGGLKK